MVEYGTVLLVYLLSFLVRSLTSKRIGDDNKLWVDDRRRDAHISSNILPYRPKQHNSYEDKFSADEQ